MHLADKQLSGTANYLASLWLVRAGCKTRSIELSTLQRAGSHIASRVDVLEAQQAARSGSDGGGSKEIVALWLYLRGCPMIRIRFAQKVKNVHKIANDERVVPREWGK